MRFSCISRAAGIVAVQVIAHRLFSPNASWLRRQANSARMAKHAEACRIRCVGASLVSLFFSIGRWLILIDTVCLSRHETALLIVGSIPTSLPLPLHVTFAKARNDFSLRTMGYVARRRYHRATQPSGGHDAGDLACAAGSVRLRAGASDTDDSAAALNLSRAEVHGVFTFYHDFRREPGRRHVLKLCRAEACQAAGGDALAARAEAMLGITIGNTTA